jgi:hypothetical protein
MTVSCMGMVGVVHVFVMSIAGGGGGAGLR